jgi:hypothetical protein
VPAFLGRTGKIHEVFNQANRSLNHCSISTPPEQELIEIIRKTPLYFWKNYRKLATTVKVLIFVDPCIVV